MGQLPPLSVLLVVNSLARGGAERIVVDLATRLGRHGVSAEVATVMGGGPLASELERAGIRHHDFGRTPRSLGIGALARAARLIRRQGYDLVHTHLWTADTWGRAAAVLVGTPVVSTEHNTNRDEGPLHRGVKRGLAQPSSALVAVSSQVREYMEDWEGISPSRIRVIRNGIDLRRFGEIESLLERTYTWSRATPGPTLGMLCRLAPQKSVDVALRALPGLREVFPHLQLQIAGDGPERPRLESLARQLGMETSVAFLGEVEDPTPLLTSWDLLLHTPAWEGFGLVVAEAMAAARPVVSSGVGGVPEVIADRDTGRLFAPGDTAALIDAVVDCLADPARARKMSRAGAERARALFGVDRMVAEYASLYREVAG